MTVTKEQAVQAGRTHTVFHDLLGLKWRSNGLCKTWVSPARAAEFRLPIKHGLWDFGYITHSNRDDFHLEGTCNCDLVKAHDAEHERLSRVSRTDIVSHHTGEHDLDQSHPGWDETE